MSIENDNDKVKPEGAPANPEQPVNLADEREKIRAELHSEYEAKRNALDKEKDLWHQEIKREKQEQINIDEFKKKYIKHGGKSEYFSQVVKLKPEIRSKKVENKTLQHWMSKDLNLYFDTPNQHNSFQGDKFEEPGEMVREIKKIYSPSGVNRLNKNFLTEYAKVLGINPKKDKKD